MIRSARAGFTLVELLAAGSIAAILMVAVLTMMAGIARDRRRLASLAQTDGLSMVDVIRRDLIAARTFGHDDNGTPVLTTFSRIDPKTLESVDRPVRLFYRIQDNNLYRVQETLDDPNLPHPFVELLAVGVSSMSMTGEEKKDGSVPSHVHLTIQVPPPATQPVDCEIWLR